MILPLISGETKWPDSIRAVIYGVGMIYFFFGVSIIADTFVASIEVVTSRRRKVERKPGRTFTVRVWNDTVATLSLMALGSSAPEIALSVIDLFKNDYFFAPLGAQTIVGSAAFNLLVIVAVCIVIVPSTETRLIKELPAFYVTAAISLFAYLWLVLILVVVTPDVVDIWEAALTFAFLPVLLISAYQVDIRDFGNTRRTPSCVNVDGLATIEEEKPTGYLDFSTEHMTIVSPSEDEILEVWVNRAGPSGPCVCSIRTEQYSAVPGYDFVEVDDRLEFEEGQMQLSYPVQLLPRRENRVARQLLFIVEAVDGEVEFNPGTDGGVDGAILTVTIEASAGSSSTTRRLDWAFNLNHLRRGFDDWLDQLISCVYCNGSLEEQREASKTDWVLHFLTFPWKLLFSLVPPTSFCGGWVCFVASLAFIGVLTAWISDLAELFGFVLGICDDVTALIFVALGTSMPDLFASLTAAREEPTADASIVNVTGSNSVNVFLGLGLPWTVGAIYWNLGGRTPEWERRYPQLAGSMQGAAFVVEAKNLGFCVLVFSCACLAALALIHLRRKFLGAELGGKFVPKVASGISLVSLWVGFLGLSSWKVMRWDEAAMMEKVLVIGGWAVSLCVASAVAVYLTVKHGSAASAKKKQSEVALRPSSSLAAFGAGDHRKKKSGYSSEDRLSQADSEASSERRRNLKKAVSTESFSSSSFSGRNGIQVSI